MHRASAVNYDKTSASEIWSGIFDDTVFPATPIVLCKVPRRSSRPDRFGEPEQVLFNVPRDLVFYLWGGRARIEGGNNPRADGDRGVLYLAENPQKARILIVESLGLTPKLEQVRRTVIRYQTEQCCYILKSSQKASLTMDPALAAQCIVGATFEVLYRWLEQDPADRPPALEMARAVADYNMRAICH